MRIIRHYEEIAQEFRSAAIALGNFDGVHRGHVAVIGEAVRRAKEKNVPAAVMTFEPHPRNVFRPDLSPFRLTPFRIKARYLEALGLDYLYCQHFDLDFAARTAEEFVDEVLVGGLGVSHVVVGEDYAFGHNRQGNVERLRAWSVEKGFDVTAVPPVLDEDVEVLSSSRIRAALIEGRVGDATKVLGRPFEIEGRVEHGDARGRTIGFPTANIALGDFLRPAAGVYAVRAGVDKGAETMWHDGVANYGRRPTFDKTDDLLEVHLFDVSDDLYQQHLRVQLVDFIRPEKRFSGLDALKAQIALDAAEARRLLATTP